MSILYSERIEEEAIDQFRVIKKPSLEKLCQTLPELTLFIKEPHNKNCSINDINYICKQMYEIGTFNKLISVSVIEIPKTIRNPKYSVSGKSPRYTEKIVKEYKAIIIVDDPVIIRRMDMVNKLKK